MKSDMIYQFRSRRASDPAEYPAALLDPRTCARDLLRLIYVLIPSPQPPINRDVRNAAIYQRRLQGESTEELAEAYGLTVQRIRAIIRRMAGKV
jgi:hypothetical protein